uniref:CCHC-type domain-containing protein n=1 Tax=Amphilophus citrinellus TaxID=61819 RepID=A0A3Q0SQJ1_AMPCI
MGPPSCRPTTRRRCRRGRVQCVSGGGRGRKPGPGLLCLGFCPRDPAPDKRKKMDGWMEHIPQTITLGENRGYIYYQNQPKVCRRCGEWGHLVESCTQVVCRKCRQVGHVIENCINKKTCNLCGSNEHLFRNCPHSGCYACTGNGEKRYLSKTGL